MNATELFQSDGKPTGIYFCGKCRIVSHHRLLADQCCQNYTCDTCGADTGARHWTLCDPCREKQSKETAKARYEKAEKIPADKYDGWVYFNGLQRNDGFAQDVGALLEDLECQREEDGSEVKTPEYVWACSPKYFATIDLDNVLENLEQDAWEDFDRIDYNGLDELQQAVDKFNESNKHLVIWEPDYSRAIILKSSRIP
jgi:hypothetical protein